VIQIGAILAVVWEFRNQLAAFTIQAFRHPFQAGFLLKLMLGFLPVAVLGLLTHKVLEELFFNPTSVAVALIGGGIVILLIERRTLSCRVRYVEEVTWRQALGIGIAQVASLMPGVSRSGATIMGGLVFGLSREAATEFSFYLAIPTMMAAGAYSLVKEWMNSGSSDFPLLLLGFVCAFVSALVILKPFTRYVRTHTFAGFAYYRILLGATLLLLTYLLT
jgi:undecaprenyl-diphosphatase